MRHFCGYVQGEVTSAVADCGSAGRPTWPTTARPRCELAPSMVQSCAGPLHELLKVATTALQNLHTRTRPITPTTSTQPTHRHTHEHAPHTQRAALTMHTLGTRGRHAQLTAAQTTQPAPPRGLPPLALPHGPPHEAPLPGEARRAAQACHQGGGRQQAEAGAARRLAGHPARQ